MLSVWDKHRSSYMSPFTVKDCLGLPLRVLLESRDVTRCVSFLREMAQTQVKILQNGSRSYFIKTALSPLTTLHKKKKGMTKQKYMTKVQIGSEN